MTILASEYGVLSEKRKVRQAVIETNILLPVRLIVALPASVSELTLVGIVLPMASRAAHRWRLHGCRLSVTGSAFSAGVLAIQGELRISLMLETNLGPAGFDVAVLAVRPEYPLVLVVLDVTAITRERRFPFLDWARVAALARRRRMLAQQRKFGRPMVERD